MKWPASAVRSSIRLAGLCIDQEQARVGVQHNAQVAAEVAVEVLPYRER